MTKKSKAIDGLPPVVEKRLKGLGKNIEIARKRRSFSQAHLAKLVLVSRNTIMRLEKGDPGVSLAVFVSTLWALQLDDDLKSVAAPDKDGLGLSLAQRNLKKRIHMHGEGSEHDF